MTAEIPAELMARIRLGDPMLCVLYKRHRGTTHYTHYLAEDRGHRHYQVLLKLELHRYTHSLRAMLIRLPHHDATRKRLTK